MKHILPIIDRVLFGTFGKCINTFSSWKKALGVYGVSLKPLLIISVILVGTGASFPTISLLSYNSQPKTLSERKQEDKAVLAATTTNSSIQLSGTIEFNLPAEFKNSVTVQGLTVNGGATLNGPVVIKGNSLDLGAGQLKASNVLYSLKTGNGLSLTTGQTPTITNTGVTSLQGQTGDITLTAGSGLSVSGTTLTNTDPGSSQKIFGKVSDGTNSLTAGNNTDKLTFIGGSGVTVSLDTTSNKFTFSTTGGSGGLSGLTTNGVLYATSATTATTVGPGTAGTLLQANGTNTPPSWVSSLTLSGLTVNGAETATTINGLTLTANGTGFSIAGGTTSKTLTTNNSLTLAGTDGTTLTFQGTDTYVGRATTDTLTNKTLTAPALNGTVTTTGLTLPALTASGTITGSGTPSITGFGTINGLTLTANGTGFSVAGGTTSKTLTLNNTMTLAAGADGQTFTFPSTSGTVCISGQTCGSSGTVGYWQRTTSGAYTSLAPSTITDTLSIGQTTGLTAAGLSVKVNALGNAAAYVENTGLGDLFTASAAGATKFVINNNGYLGIGTTTPSYSLSIVNGGADTIHAGQPGNQDLFRVDNGGHVSAGAYNYNNNNSWFINFAGGQTSLPGYLTLNDAGGTNPLASLDVRSATPYSSAASFSTLPIASISGTTTFATLVVDNSGKGDLFTASVSGATRFVINNNGNLTSSAGSQWKPSSDSTTGLQIANSSGTSLINFDTTNSFLKLGTATSIYSGGTCKGTGVNEACAGLHVVSSTGNHNIIFENTGPNLLTLANASGGIPWEWTFNVSANQLGDFSVADGNGFTPFYINPNPNWMAIGRGFNAPKGVLHVQGGNTGGNAGFIVNQTGASTNDIIAASASGITKFVVNSSGNVGIGTSNPNYTLDIQNNVSATAAAQIYNTNTTANSGGLIIKLGYTGTGTAPTSQTTGNNFMRFLNGNGIAQGSIDSNGSGGITYATGGVDFAEYFKKDLPEEHFEAGDVVCLGKIGGVTKCTTGSKLLGVVSQNAGFVGGGNHAGDNNYVLVGLVGQLPVKVSTASGNIVFGDVLTASNIAGVAQKQTTTGQSIAKALESSEQSQNGKIMAYVNAQWYDPGFIASAMTSPISLSTSAAALTQAIDGTPLSISNATVSGTLSVIGKTLVNDLGITGKITSGILSIYGYNGEINTLTGNLKLQSEGLGGIDILAGKVTIDTNGNTIINGSLTAKSVTTGKLNITADTNSSQGVLGTSAGVVSIKSGQQSVTVQTNQLTPKSLIFVTPDNPVAIAAKKVDSQTFQILLSSPAPQDLQVNWWIVN